MQFSGDLRDPTVLDLIALFFLTYWLVYRPLKFLLSWLLNQCQCASRRILKPGPNEYAVVTGATDGMGLEFAKQLAAKGYNLVLLSRTEDKLVRVSEEIAKLYPQCKDIQHLAVDFSHADIYESIERKLTSLKGSVRVLVNNVGIMNSVPNYFAQFTDGYHQRMININCVAVTSMSEIALRLMVTNELKNKTRGVIINISSATGVHAYPLMATYSASKAYMNYLCKALSTEYAPQGIVIQVVTPGMVDTALSAGFQASAGSSLAVSAESLVRNALAAVGSERQTSAHPKHKLINGSTEVLADLLGDSLTQKLLFTVNKGIKDTSDKKVQPVV